MFTRKRTQTRHQRRSLNLSKRVFAVFVKYSCRFVRFVVKEYFRVTLLTIKTKRKMKKETWKFVIQTILAVLSAIATSLGVTSCMVH